VDISVTTFHLISFAPSSPWWLVRKNRIEEAEKVVKRITDESTGLADHRGVVALMV
jgi:SP family general alpha glucoside:H+ symporter-like MFS transporter